MVDTSRLVHVLTAGVKPVSAQQAPVGPGTPPALALFELGIDMLSGPVVAGAAGVVAETGAVRAFEPDLISDSAKRLSPCFRNAGRCYGHRGDAEQSKPEHQAQAGHDDGTVFRASMRAKMSAAERPENRFPFEISYIWRPYRRQHAPVVACSKKKFSILGTAFAAKAIHDMESEKISTRAGC